MVRAAFIPGVVEARAFLAARPGIERVIALTPAARAVLDAGGIRAIASSEVYSDRAHARVIARLRRARRKLAAMIAERPLDAAAAESLMLLTNEVCISAGAMWE